MLTDACFFFPEGNVVIFRKLNFKRSAKLLSFRRIPLYSLNFLTNFHLCAHILCITGVILMMR